MILRYGRLLPPATIHASSRGLMATATARRFSIRKCPIPHIPKLARSRALLSTSQIRGRADVVPPTSSSPDLQDTRTRQDEINHFGHAKGGDASDCPRNPVGVQLLSASLQEQLFPATAAKTPAIHHDALSLSQHHLKLHGLEPEQAAALPPIAFDLPPLQGKDLGQHFWNLGRQVAQPWLGMAHNLASARVHDELPTGICEPGSNKEQSTTLHDEGILYATDWLDLDTSIRHEFRPRPPPWLKVPGWVRYPVLTSTDGKVKALGDGESVEYPLPSDGALVFDIECMVQEGPFAVMATAAGPRAWYAWLSPWLLQRGQRCHEKDHLVPFGPSDGAEKQPARLLIGHNVGFDRARVRDEYSLQQTNIRWLDTMSLHVATHGISSPQRGAWIKHSKSRLLQSMLEKDDVETEKKRIIEAMLGGAEVDEDILAQLDLEELVAEGHDQGRLQFGGGGFDPNSSNPQAQTWQDITSKNSLADVAKLHCNIDISKDTRDVFVDGTSREEIVERLDELLTYCANDTLVTHKVFKEVWPAFIKNCPNPVTTAGILGLGSTLLPVDDEWTDYIERCDSIYESSLREVRDTLIELAENLKTEGTRSVSWEDAERAAGRLVASDIDSRESSPTAYEMDQHEGEDKRQTFWWETDPWARQLDWTPKKPKKARSQNTKADDIDMSQRVPRWYRDKILKSPSGIGRSSSIASAILRLHYQRRPVVKREDGKWVARGETEGEDIALGGSPLRQAYMKSADAANLRSSSGEAGKAALEALRSGQDDEEIRKRLRAAADELSLWARGNQEAVAADRQLATLDWTYVERPEETADAAEDGDSSRPGKAREWWPKWYWDLIKSATGQLEVTIRSKIAPLLLRLAWQGCPLHHSREHGWVFRYDPRSSAGLYTRQKPLKFAHPADAAFRHDISRTVDERLQDYAKEADGKDGNILEPASITPVYFKVPHVAGDDSNVGSPFAKGFIPLFEKGTLQSEHPDERGRMAAKRALETNARCSYWIGARDRVSKQVVVWDGQGGSRMQFKPGASGARQNDKKEEARRKGIILPQVVPMGTVTRRAIEKTWLTASNAKANRVGSELKAMVKAPPGWSIVGADVDSQELWICSVIGDAQFGFHGATAVGWMTLEGSKSIGTDLHSKTASILGTGRNQAKVFNYSRIYGAGIRHSSQLLLKATPDMSSEEAMRKAKELYASTKGKNTYSSDYFGRRFWYGGTESFVFNKLEDIALGEQPKTPALDCGVTAALRRKYLPNIKLAPRRGNGRGASMTSGGDYMPSRVNWVVQSSGVDYLHLLITAMEYLISTYDLKARFMISVHDEVRYLAQDEDSSRVALALQIANLWTRSMFAYKLQMESLPQGVGFFAQVDVDKVLRKEADDACVTPSHTHPIPFGKAIDIYASLNQTKGGSLYQDGRPMRGEMVPSSDRSWLIPQHEDVDLSLPKYSPSKQKHRSSGLRGLRYLQAQASDDINEIAALEARLQVIERDDEAPFIKQRTASSPSAVGTNTFRAGARQKPASPSRAMSSAKFHTSAVTASELPASLQSIVNAFPQRPVRFRVPFFKTREHILKIRWQVYRRLLQSCDKVVYPHLHTALREEVRVQRHNTSPRQTTTLEQQAWFYIKQFEKERAGDEDALQFLQSEDSRFQQEQRERRLHFAQERYIAERAEASKPRPRASGSLLPPTFFNPPLLRYKPTQPLHITMMIKSRRLARMRHHEQYIDSTERMHMLQAEAKLWSQVEGKDPSPYFGDAQGWMTALNDSERAILRARFGRDLARSKMQFGTRMLRAAKLARRAKIRSHLRKKQILGRLHAAKSRERRRSAASIADGANHVKRDASLEGAKS